MLSSFINRRKVKNSKISLFDAALRRAPSYSPLDEGLRSKQWTKSHVPALSGLRSSALHRQSSPKVYLDFDTSGSNDWFPKEILASPDEDCHLPIQSVPQSSASSMYDDVVVIGPAAVSSFLFFSRAALILISSKPSLEPSPSPALSPLPVYDGPPPTEPGYDVCSLSSHAIYIYQQVDSHHHSRPVLRPYHGNLHRRQLRYLIICQRSRFNTLLPRAILS